MIKLGIFILALMAVDLLQFCISQICWMRGRTKLEDGFRYEGLAAKWHGFSASKTWYLLKGQLYAALCTLSLAWLEPKPLAMNIVVWLALALFCLVLDLVMWEFKPKPIVLDGDKLQAMSKEQQEAAIMQALQDRHKL